jgi:hypothetical protein
MIRARIYTRGEVSFAKFLFLPSWFAKLCCSNSIVLRSEKLANLVFTRVVPVRCYGHDNFHF